jgi:hypothetical protein
MPFRGKYTFANVKITKAIIGKGTDACGTEARYKRPPSTTSEMPQIPLKNKIPKTVSLFILKSFP